MGLLRWHEGRNAEALTLIEQALVIDREWNDEDAVAGDLVSSTSILKSLGNYEAAQARIEEALALPSLAQNPKKLVYALHNLANIHRGRGDMEAALASLHVADQMAAQMLPIQRSFHLTSIAHIELHIGHIEEAIGIYKEAVELSRRARHAEGLAQSLRTLAVVLFELGRFADALPYLQEAAALFAQLEDDLVEADMWSKVAVVRERTGAFAESLESWMRVQTLRRRLGDSRGQLAALEGLARAMRQLDGATDTTVSAFEAALDLASTLGEWNSALICRNTLGILEWTRGRFTNALAHYEAGLMLAREQMDQIQEGVILNSLGVTLLKLDRPEEARTALEESAALNRRTGQRLLEAHALTGLGQVARSLSRFDRALEYFDQSRVLRDQAGDRVGEGWMWRRVAEMHALLGNMTAAQDAAAAAARLAETSADGALIAACAAELPAVHSARDHNATLHH
jgi:tetratricopeptide (TPR) repeat protein